MPDIIKVLEEWKVTGYKEMKNGTLLIGLNTEIRKDFWVHRIYSSLSNDQINNFESEANIKFPDAYKRFLNRCNGIFLFGGYLYIFGRSRLEKGMSKEEQMFQPYDLIEENDDPPFKIPDHLFYFGGSPDAIYALDRDENVVKLKRKSGKIISQWPDLQKWLISEITILNNQ